ncbi:MAG: TldD/PmbA family protein [Desulfurococcales archaeon]|nr:TldD/PmbA family protein [Desulfurococcales archaeon]
MNPVEIVEDIVRVVKGRVPEYIVIVNENTSSMLKLANGEPSIIQSWREYTVSLYAAKNNKILISSFKFTAPEEAVKRSIDIIDKLQPSPLYAPLPEPTGKPFSNVDEKIIEMAGSSDLSTLIEDLELEALGNAAGMITVSLERTALETSNGGMLEGERTHFNGYMRVFVADDTSGQWSWTSTRYDPNLAKKAISTAENLAKECGKLPKVKLETGVHRVLLSPMVVGNLMEATVRAASGAAVIFGMSFFRNDEVGGGVASEKLSLLDRPLNKDLPGYTLFDEEAVETRDKYIIERGVLKTLLHNSKTAKLLGGETTGNAGLLWPRPFNLEIEPGDMKDAEMLEVLGDGVYATNNWYTRFQNYTEGLFSTVTRDALFVVKRGKPVGCSNRVRITGSMRELLLNIEGVGTTRWPIEWWEVATPSLLPHILVSKAGITSE